MDYLRELILVILNQYSSQQVTRHLFTKKNSKISLLFRLVLESTIKNDDELAKKIGYSSSKSKSFIMLKSRLEKKLLSYVISKAINSENKNNYKSVIASCYENLSCSKILIINSARISYTRLLEKLFNLSKKYNITELCLLISKDLKYYYSVKTYNKRKYNIYLKAYTNYNIIFQQEEKAERYFGELIMNFNILTRQNKIDFLNLEYTKVKEIQSILETTKSYRLCFIAYAYLLAYYAYANKYHIVREHIENALTYFKSLTFVPIIPFNYFYGEKIKYLIKYRNYQEALSLIKNINTIPSNGSTSWFFLQLYTGMVHLHIKQYTTAGKIIDNCVNHERFHYLSPIYQELLLIMGGYIKLLQPGTNTKYFRIGKLVNSLPIFSANKRGLNISILILHFLFLIKQKKYSRSIDRVESLTQYTYRYLREDENFRSNCFIKMITQIPKANFDGERSRKYAEKYYDQLVGEPLDVANQPIDVEIIPYEDLWEITLGILKENQKISA